MKLERRTIAAMAALAVLAACGGGGNSAPPETVERTARALAGPELPGGHCPAGGARIDAGIDSDGNGVLDAGEIASTQYVCDGATGAAGATGPTGLAGAPGIAGPMGPSGVAALVQMSAESAGAHCTSGGTRIAAGADVNGNGVLDPVEVTSVGYVCAAADGVDGHDNLMRMATEGASVACPSGGSRIESGRDGNGNGSLDIGEVTATALVCNGANGANGTNGTNGTNGANGASGYASLTHSVAESAGANCAAGGIKITSGADTDRDGMLDDPGEVTATSYVCNGFGAWVEVTAVAVQSEPNTGYVASSGTEVTVTLPANPNVGNVVRVSGAGTGGWRIAQNPGQSIVTAHLDVASVAKAWTVNGYAGDYRAVASSADGNRLFATQPMDFPVVSADAGLTWSVVGPGMGNWNSLASSADGRRLVLAGGGEHIYVSDDFGATWAARETPRGWTAVAMSADGRVIASTVVSQQVFVSTDYGVTWAARGASRFWSAIAMSADGSRIAAAENGGQIDISSDYGASWTSHAGALSWRSLASSADGRRLVAVAENAPIYTSEDFGVSWTARDSARLWAGVASSADGNRLVAVASGDANAAQYDPDFIYASSDQGLTWTRRGTADAWAGVASSADGSRLAAVTNGYGSFSFWTSVPAPVAITTAGSGWIAGKQYQAIELQYVGGNRFMVLDAIGSGFEAQ